MRKLDDGRWVFEHDDKEYIVQPPLCAMPFAGPMDTKSGPVIVGTMPWIPYTKDLYDHLLAEWAQVWKEYIDQKPTKLVKRVQSDSSDETYEVVAQKFSKEKVFRYSCTCKGFQYRGHCKHIDRIKESMR